MFISQNFHTRTPKKKKKETIKLIKFQLQNSKEKRGRERRMSMRNSKCWSATPWTSLWGSEGVED